MGPRSSDTISSQLLDIFLACFLFFLNKTMFSKVLLSLYFLLFVWYPFSIFEFEFWAEGSAPLLIVSHSFNIKFNQPIKQHIY